MIDLKTQLGYFKNLERLWRNKLGDEEVKTLLARAVHLFSIGNNDYIAPFFTNSSTLESYSKQEYVDIVIGNLTNVIKVIKTNIVYNHLKHSIQLNSCILPSSKLGFNYFLMFYRKYIRTEEGNLGL